MDKLAQRQERKRVRSVNAKKRKQIKEWTKAFKISFTAYDYAWYDPDEEVIVFYANTMYDDHFTSRPGYIRTDPDMLDTSFNYYIFEMPKGADDEN